MPKAIQARECGTLAASSIRVLAAWLRATAMSRGLTSRHLSCILVATLGGERRVCLQARRFTPSITSRDYLPSAIADVTAPSLPRFGWAK